ncbi:unnamed protein product [Ectocarpus sp. 12 AP-2014]
MLPVTVSVQSAPCGVNGSYHARQEGSVLCFGGWALECYTVVVWGEYREHGERRERSRTSWQRSMQRNTHKCLSGVGRALCALLSPPVSSCRKWAWSPKSAQLLQLGTGRCERFGRSLSLLFRRCFSLTMSAVIGGGN